MNTEDNSNNFTINYSINISTPETTKKPLSANPAENIILVGTAHVSQKSVAEVEETIERERPDAVAVELCPARYQALTNQVETKDISVGDVLGGGKLSYFIIHWLLAYVQRKIGSDLGVEPGAEMLQAIRKAESTGAKIVLADRDIQITLQRFWHTMSIREKLKMTWSLLTAALGFGGQEIDIETVTEQDVVTRLMEELRTFAPSAARVFVDERDAYMAANLLNAGRSGRVVAVVGAGHLEGIKKYLADPKTIPPQKELVTVPKKRFGLTKIIGLTFIALVLAAFLLVILAVIKGALSPYVLLVALGYWIVINGVLSAAGAALARGHPKSIITAFLVAWFTSLNPMIAAGWFAGLMEAKERKPTTDDIRTMMEAETFKEMLNNRMFRVILVASLANLGSIVGTFLGAYVILSLTGIDPRELVQNIFNSYF